MAWLAVRQTTVWPFSRRDVREADATTQTMHAFEAMVAHDWDRFYRYAYRLCGGNPDDTEDLLSESLLDAYRSFSAYRGEGFDRWFFRMIANNRIDMARRAKVRKAESLDSGYSAWSEGETREIPDENASPERQLLAPLYSEPLQMALDSLPEDFRVVILLCDVEQLDYQEAADTLGIPVGTVRSRIHRGRNQMRNFLEKNGWHP